MTLLELTPDVLALTSPLVADRERCIRSLVV
jgi:hypothetical protein